MNFEAICFSVLLQVKNQQSKKLKQSKFLLPACVSLARFCVLSEDKVKLEKVCFHVSKHCGDKDKIMKNANM